MFGLKKTRKKNVEVLEGCITKLHVCIFRMPPFSMASFLSNFPLQLPAGVRPVWNPGWRLQFEVHALVGDTGFPLSVKCGLLLHQYHVHFECYSNLYVCQVSHAKDCLLLIKQKPLRISGLVPVVFRLKRFFC